MQKQNKKQIWKFPWGFAESILIITSLMISGFMIDLFSMNKAEIKFSYPNNLIIIGVLFISAIIIFLVFKKSKFVKWLQSAQLAIVTISWLLFLVLLMGVFKQENSTEFLVVKKLYLNNILQSSAFFLLQLVLFLNISFALFNRFSKFNIKNISFILNHLGILILIVALGFGSGDISKHTLKISKNNFTWNVKQGNSVIELPFAFKLVDFKLENFPAKIGIIDNKTDNILKGNDKIMLTGQDSVIHFNGKLITLKKYINNSVQFGENFHPVNEIGSCPSAFIQINDENNNKKTAWISRGSHLYPSVLFEIDSSYTLGMLEPEAKSYKSDIAVYFKDGKTKKYTIEVNKPVNINGWDIYQTDYNKEMGEWSDYSVIEMVYDPWLDIVYLGVFTMLAGVILLIFTGKQQNNDLV